MTIMHFVISGYRETACGRLVHETDDESPRIKACGKCHSFAKLNHPSGVWKACTH